MKSLLPSFLLLIACLNTLSGQQTRYFETGFLLGLTNYSGDVAESAVEFSEFQPGYGLYFRYHFSSHFAAKAHLYSGSISGDDANSSTLNYRKLKFSTSIFEFGLVGEWHILGKERYSNTGIHNFFITPYLFGGLGFTFADAKAEFYGTPEEAEIYARPGRRRHPGRHPRPPGAGGRIRLAPRFFRRHRRHPAKWQPGKRRLVLFYRTYHFVHFERPGAQKTLNHHAPIKTGFSTFGA